ncbi:MAG: alginate lyase family protein [Hyphomonadaceae bacterium]|nr:alginate lyase family protein [Hyphomonadaceae bacterium]
MDELATIERYWQTIRWLRPVQLYGRIGFRLARPSIDLRPSPPLRAPSGVWVTPARRAQSLTGPSVFFLLNEYGALPECGWDDPQREKLWRYNQHYFDDLNAIGAEARRDWQSSLLDNWLEHNPPGVGTGWEPYPVSLRVVNWIKFVLGGGDLSDNCRESLAVQTRWLVQRLEWHLLGNHLFANAKALIFAGLWFGGDEATAWLKTGFRILAQEVAEQILPDGCQFELSPMYHALALEDVLDLINVSRRYAGALSSDQTRQVADWCELAPAMNRWLQALSHPDGQIAFFNDAAFGIAPHNSELEAYVRRLRVDAGPGLEDITWLKESGYVRLSQGDAVLIADIARVGPDYLPGHAHADTLSFEFSLFGHRLFVNSGVSCYGTSTERLRQRGTAAHNTVIVSNQNSSDVWSGFRVGRRALPLEKRVARDGTSLSACAAHDGYRHLRGQPLHRRSWTLSQSALCVTDTFDAAHAAEARFHLHPDVSIEVDANDPGRGSLRMPDGETISWQSEAGPARLEATTWHPEFGKHLPSTCLVLPLRDGRSTITLNWGATSA